MRKSDSQKALEKSKEIQDEVRRSSQKYAEIFVKRGKKIRAEKEERRRNGEKINSGSKWFFVLIILAILYFLSKS